MRELALLLEFPFCDHQVCRGWAQLGSRATRFDTGRLIVLARGGGQVSEEACTMAYWSRHGRPEVAKYKEDRRLLPL